MKTTALLTVLALFIAALAMPADAAEDKKSSHDREQIRRLQQGLQKAEQEKTSLQAEKSAVDEQLKASGEKVENLEKSAHRAAALAARQLSAQQQEKEALNARLAESEKRIAQLDEAHKKSQAENSQLQAQMTRLNKDLAASEAKNLQLYSYSLELLDKYRNKGLLASMAQAEPLTGLKRIEIENLLEEYRDKLDDQKVEPSSR